MLADIGRELQCTGHASIPLLLGQALFYFSAGDATLQHAEHEAGVEVVACSDGAHRRRLLHGVLLLQPVVGPQLYGLGAAGADELLGVEGYLRTVDLVGIGLAEHHLEVLARTAHNVGHLQILQNIRCQLQHLVLVRGSEVHVVVQNGTLRAGILQESHHLRPYDGVHGVVRAEEHHVVGIHRGVGELQPVVRMVFIEEVLGIVVLVEEGQRDGRLGVGIDVDRLGVNAVLFEETDDTAPHAVVASLADEGAAHARAPQRDETVEHRPARHGANGLVLFKHNVKNGLAYSYYASHKLSSFTSIVSFAATKV